MSSNRYMRANGYERCTDAEKKVRAHWAVTMSRSAERHADAMVNARGGAALALATTVVTPTDVEAFARMADAVIKDCQQSMARKGHRPAGGVPRASSPGRPKPALSASQRAARSRALVNRVRALQATSQRQAQATAVQARAQEERVLRGGPGVIPGWYRI